MRSKILLLAIFLAFTVFVQGAGAKRAGTFVDTRLDGSACETFTVGESGHSDYCKGPAGYGLVIHYRRARIDVEIARPGEVRAKQVLRLRDYLEDGQRRFSDARARWFLVGDEAKAVTLFFKVEPRPYEKFIPFRLVFRIGKPGEDCAIATLSGWSKRDLDEVMRGYESAACRPVFKRQTRVQRKSR